ncbi:MAG: hypothetical protein ACYCV7_15950 [Acidimicrobiales bacterium]
MRPVTNIGLLLEAGGLTGQEFHAGVLAALELDLVYPHRHDMGVALLK